MGDAESLYVLPMDYQGRKCYRVCWGRFDDRDQAAVADLPSSLPDDLRNPTPREIADVAP